MVVNFIVESCLIINNEPCGQVVIFLPSWELCAEFMLFDYVLWFQSLEQMKFLWFYK
jgi:hypothetical protein